MTILTGQEERILKNEPIKMIVEEDKKIERGRLDRMLRGFRDKPPFASLERAKLFTESFKQTEGLPIVFRWAKALEHTLKNISIYIQPDELIVGRIGPSGRYGIIYPELQGSYLENAIKELPNQTKTPFSLSEDDIAIIRDELLPYWRGKSFLEIYSQFLPQATRKLMFKDDDIYTASFLLTQSNTIRHSLQWCLDYKKVLENGFNGIKEDAQKRINSLDVYSEDNNYEKIIFYKSVIIVCEAVVVYSKRYAQLAKEMAEKETNPKRSKELQEISKICEKVPGNPASSFREAIQSQWFTQLVSRLECLIGGIIGNGRIDQYLYPYYKKDIDKGQITSDDVLLLLGHLWLNIAQSVRVMISASEVKAYEGYIHFEQTSVGGLTREGEDATNELSYLVLESKKEFPLNYPDLSVRIHSQTPEAFLWKVSELIKEGTGFPKLYNDEEIIPFYLAKGEKIEDANDYTPTGCVDVRTINRHTYMPAGPWINLDAIFEMTLNDGVLKSLSCEPVGARTGDPREFNSYDDVWNAFKDQVEYIMKHAFIHQRIVEKIRPEAFASPMLSSLHDLCMEDGKDIQEGKIKNALSHGPDISLIGLGTVIDSLYAIKKLVYIDKLITMEEMLDALNNNFEGKEDLRQMCLNVPKYGNNIKEVDQIGREIEKLFVSISHKYTNLYGGKPQVKYVPITHHIPSGKVVKATPNGRKAGEMLSEGVSTSHGCDKKGVTVTLLSVANTKEINYTERGPRLLNIKLSPSVFAGREGTKKLMSLIRSWCDMKHWHVQFNIINQETLIAAQKDPEKYRNLMVRVAGYSAYFVELSKEVQDEIIARTSHQKI